MSRIKIDEPFSYDFTAIIHTRVTDLNYAGHVGNDRIFAFMHDARVQYLKSLGYQDEMSFDGLGFIQTDAAITYKAEIFAQEIIKISIGVTDHNKYGFDFVYRFIKEDNRLAALGKTGIVFLDYQKRKITEMPQDFAQKIGIKS